MPEVVSTARARNRRGEGARLREDIVQAATELLEQTGQDDAITLRAVARAAGVTAPSIYAHFADRDEIKTAVIERTFSALAQALRDARPTRAKPVNALYAVCRGYLDFAEQHPHLYRVLFERHRREALEPGTTDRDVTTMIGADAFGVLLQAAGACIASGDSTETSVPAATTRVWVSLHGMASLRASLPWFPWPARETLMTQLVRRAADLHPPTARRSA